MKVTIFSAYANPHTGGYCKNVQELSKRLVARGYKVDIVTCNTENAPAQEECDGVSIRRIPCWHLLNKTYPVPKPSRALLDIWANKPDVAVTQTRFFATSLMGLAYSWFWNAKLIHVERGSVHTVMDNAVLSWLSRCYDHTLGSLVIRGAKVNVGISEKACGLVNHLGGKARFIPNGIEIADGELAPHAGKIRVVYVGRLIYAKGVQDLVQAFKMAKLKNPNMELWIVGDGNYRAELERLANGDKDIRLIGEVPQKQVTEILRQCDIFVNPSYSEGLPTSVMEAAAVGLPIIATDVGGTKEIIKAGESGLLVPIKAVKAIADHILALADNEHMRKQLGAAAKKAVASKFSWDKIVREWDEMLKEVTGEN